MNAIQDETIFSYLAGSLSAHDAAGIEAALASDETLRGRVQLMASIAGIPLPIVLIMATQEPSSGGFKRRFLRLLRPRRIVLTLAFLVACGTVSCAAYFLLVTPPLLQDNFNQSWIDPRLWKTGRRSIKAENGHLRLTNRGSIVTQQEFPVPISLTFRWRWIDLAGDSHYRDTLTVALRTSGRHAPKHPYEIFDGIAITFQAHSGQISIAEILDPGPPHPTPLSSFPMPADSWRDIRITDDGQTICVFIKGPGIDPKFWETPAHQFRPVGNYATHHIAFYNREFVSEVPHESEIDDIVIRALSASGR